MKIIPTLTILFLATMLANGQSLYTKAFGNPNGEPLIPLYGGYEYNCAEASYANDKQPALLEELKPNILREKGAEIFQYWEFKNEPSLWDTNFVQPLNLRLYKDSLSSLLGEDSLALVMRRLAIQDESFKSVETQNGDLINAQHVQEDKKI